MRNKAAYISIKLGLFLCKAGIGLFSTTSKGTPPYYKNPYVFIGFNHNCQLSNADQIAQRMGVTIEKDLCNVYHYTMITGFHQLTYLYGTLFVFGLDIVIIIMPLLLYYHLDLDMISTSNQPPPPPLIFSKKICLQVLYL